jgi:hypothetical protein
MPRRMHEMLHPMHRYRRCRVGDIEDALHPQQRIAMAVKQHRQPDTEPRPIDRLVEAERQSSDIIGVEMMNVGRMAMASEGSILALSRLQLCAIGYFVKISSTRLKAFAAAACGSIPSIMMSVQPVLQTCSFWTWA